MNQIKGETWAFLQAVFLVVLAICAVKALIDWRRNR